MNNSAGFEAPLNSGKKALFSSGLWIGAQKPNSELVTAIIGYNGSDFKPGPIMDEEFYATESSKYNRLWSLSCEEIETFIEYYKCFKDPLCVDTLNFPNYEIPEAIVNWPGNGDVSKGMSESLASYVDANNDGIYNHLDGDFPAIYGEQYIYFIMHDEGVHGQSGSDPMRLEVRVGVYVGNFDTSQGVVDNTVYVRYEIINAAAVAYNNMYIGTFSDFEIGSPDDNYIGSLPNSNAYYAYNGDNYDNAYLDTAVAMGVAILGGPYMDSDGVDNPISTVPGQHKGLGFADDQVDNERLGLSSFISYNFGGGTTGDPQDFRDYYDYMRNTWRDGTKLKYGGNGHLGDCAAPFSCNNAAYMFPDNKDVNNIGTGESELAWDEASAGLSPGYRTGLGVSGPFSMLPGQIQTLDMAYVFATAYEENNNKAAISVLESYIEELGLPNVGRCARKYDGIKKTIDQSLLSVYPNPSNNAITLEASHDSFTWAISSFLGQELMTGTSSSKTHKVDVSHLPIGTYLVTIQTGQNIAAKKLQIIR